MKQILIFFAMLFFCKSGMGQAFIINYNQSSNTMSVVYTGCEICRMGSVGAVSNCECWYKCSDEVLQGLEECLDDCDVNNEPGSLDREYCVDYCINYLHNPGVVCPQYCGEYSAPVREVVAYRYRLHADWANIPFDPLASPANRISTPFVDVTSSSITIPFWQVPAPWPEIHTGHNTCYGIEILILYDDGLVCGGTIWECNIIG